MAHYLSTINPAAAAAYDRPPDETPAREHPIAQESRVTPPGVGTPVVYHCRHGEGRMMLQEFPAVVHSHNPDGTISLIVDYDADDRIRVRSVGLRTPENDRPSYSIIQPIPTMMLDELIIHLQTAITGMEAAATAQVEFEQRLTALEAPPVKRGPGRPPKPKE